MKERDIVWVSKELVETVKQLDESTDNTEEIKNLFAKFKKEIVEYEYDIDEVVVNLHKQSRKIKDAIKTVIEEETNELYEFWEELDKKRYEVQKNITKAAEVIKDSKLQINTLKEGISSINFYGIDKLIDVVERINRMSDSEKELLSRLFDQYKDK